MHLFFLLFFSNFIYLWLCWFSELCRLFFFLVEVNGGYSLFAEHGLLIVMASLVGEHGS